MAYLGEAILVTIAKSIDVEIRKRRTRTQNHTTSINTKNIPLAEQILLGNKSVFLQIDNDGNPITSVKLDLSKDQGLILEPQQDGINGVASFTLPVKFKDHKEIKDFIDIAKHQTIDSIYLQHKALWRKFVVANDESTDKLPFHRLCL